MTSTESAQDGRHAAPAGSADQPPAVGEPGAPGAAADGPYVLRRRTAPLVGAGGTSSPTAPAQPTAPPAPPMPGAYVPPPPTQMPPPSYFDDYVHPDYAVHWQKKQSHAGRVVGLLLVLLLAVGGGYWYFELRTTGVPYHSEAGHFSARFPHTPQSEEQSLTSNGYPMHEVVASDDKGKTAAGMLSFDSLPNAANLPDDTVLQAGMAGAAAAAHLTNSSEKATTFHGKPARVGQFTDPDGVTATMMIVKYDATRFYLMIAAPGKPFDNLERSFTMLP
jgi:hypothetical protein